MSADEPSTRGGAAARPGGLLWRSTNRFTAASRQRRFETFMSVIEPDRATTVLDVGVTDSTWRASNFLEAHYPWPAQITAVAPAPVPAFSAAFPDVRVVVADGRRLPFDAGTFDVGFSNAVVEHVGSREDQRHFIGELLRTCRRVFVSTPNRSFPVDPHTLLPFAHWLPRRAWHAILRLTGNARWASEAMLNPLGARELLALFPPGVPVGLVRQRTLGLTTVLIAVADGPESLG